MFIVGSSIVQDILYEGLAEEKVVALLVLGCFGGSVGGLRRATHYLVDDALFSILLGAESADIDADDEVVVIYFIVMMKNNIFCGNPRVKVRKDAS